jgi:hypothetical protein
VCIWAYLLKQLEQLVEKFGYKISSKHFIGIPDAWED